MKVKFLKLKNWLLVSLMGALGFSSCHSHKQMAEPEAEPDNLPKVEDGGQMRLMYGVPTMNFMIRGQVKDADGKPVRDIRVNMLERGMVVQDGELQGDPENVQRWLDGTSVATDGEGRFAIDLKGRPQDEVRLLVRDVDGKANGSFRNELVGLEVRSEDVDRSDAAGMHEGTFKKELDISLQEK